MINFGWPILFLFLSALSYTAWIIKKEKKTFLENPIPYKIGPFFLNIPKWWSLVENKKDQIIFERKDTKYEWKATFKVLKDISDFKSLDDQLINFVKNKKIIFDPESSDINFKNNLNNLELIQVGGTATENGIDRIYYDIAILKSNQDFIICESKSSVLNGAVEGPYFEEVIGMIPT